MKTLQEEKMRGNFLSYNTHLFFLFLATAVLIIGPMPIFLHSTSAQNTGILFNGDKVEVLLNCQISTDTIRAGTKFTAKVKENVGKAGDTYIYKDDPVFATIDSVKKNGWYGKGAELVVRFDSTFSSGGTIVPLKGKWRDKGKNRKTLAYILFFIGWAIKGKNIETSINDSCVTEVYAPDPPGYIEIEYIPYK
jgi:hypothetical protein